MKNEKPEPMPRLFKLWAQIVGDDNTKENEKRKE